MKAHDTRTRTARPQHDLKVAVRCVLDGVSCTVHACVFVLLAVFFADGSFVLAAADISTFNVSEENRENCQHAITTRLKACASLARVE